MAIAKMKLINITGDIDKLNETLIKFIDYKDFHAIEASEFGDRVRGLELMDSEFPCRTLQSELDYIEETFEHKYSDLSVRQMSNTVEQMEETIDRLVAKLEVEEAAMKQIVSDIKLYKETLTQVSNIEQLEVALDDIFSLKYVAVRFGRLSLESLERLKYYKNKPFLIKLFAIEEQMQWCMYMTSQETKGEIDHIFNSLFFERVRIPDFVRGTPEAAKAEIQKKLEILEIDYATRKKRVKAILNENEETLNLINAETAFLCKVFNARKYVLRVGTRFSITGFVEEKNADSLVNYYKEVETLDVDVRPADSDKRIIPPTKLKNRWFARPFQTFVQMYSLPSHKDIDPTLFLAITYTLLFGLMFGDLGQGLALLVLGVILSKWKKMNFGGILVRLGISSAIFGLLYGSFFGNETILTPLYTKVLGLKDKPIHIMDNSFTMTLLIATVGIGAVLILSAIITNAYIRFRNKDYGEAILSSDGLLGLMLYGFIVAALALNSLYGINIINPFTIIIFAIIPTIGIFLKGPILNKIKGQKMFQSGIGGFIVEGFFELFVVFLSYITNTLSFLRVGGFILSHAGMMLVVATLMKMVGSSSSWIVAILGNIFVMGLEGLIVGIQVLRLEFYEMFSRYYIGGGIEFKSNNY